MTAFAKLMPDVALVLLGEPNARPKKSEWRYGTNGSLSVDVERGQWFSHEDQKGGGVLALIERECQTDEAGAIQWLRDNGHLPESSTRRAGRFKRRSSRPTRQHRTRAERPRTAQKPKPKTAPSGETERAKSLWAESELIPPFKFAHPFWRWVTTGDKPGTVEPDEDVPRVVQWHQREGVIVALRNTFDAWLNGRQECFSVAVVAIDAMGNKRRCFKGQRDKSTFGGGADGVFLGDPQCGKIGICEGLADALALYNHFSGIKAVWATTSAIGRVANTSGACEWLAEREVVLYTDADGTGQDAGLELKKTLLKWGPKIEPLVVSRYPFGVKDPAAVAAYQSAWAYEMEEKRGMLIGSGLPEEKAEKLALGHLIERYEND